MNDDDELMHYGILRKSGRYPWGSGGNPLQRSKSFRSYYDDLRNQGLTPGRIASLLDFKSTTELRAALSISSNQILAANISQAQRLKAKDMSTVAIGKQMGVNESTVRSWLKQSEDSRSDKLQGTVDMLRKNVDKSTYIDVGPGVSTIIGVNPTRFKTAVASLKEEGYKEYFLPVEQLGNPGKFTNTKILASPDTTFGMLMKDISQVKTINGYAESNGSDFKEILPPVSVNSKRVGVRYADDGGATKDGVIELRRGVPDISLGEARYAQVRIAVDGTHYLKGMAMYSDDLPAGVDMVFNTNKKLADMQADVASGKAPDVKRAAMKSIKTKDGGGVDEENPFGATVRQKTYIDASGKQKQSVMNIVNEEGGEQAWHNWSKTLSSQMLSKQSPALAKQQLDLSYDIKKQEYDDIMALTNPVIKKKLLEGFADGADSASLHLKAAGLPRTANHVILPINSLKDNEIYAPQYRNGETVVLIRHPHGGIFEIPELTVNNRNREAGRVMKNAQDAVGINSRVAQRLSGADFDGDAVLVIPNNRPGISRIKTKSPLHDLKDFDPQEAYRGYPGMKPMKNKQNEMGKISNLITDMTIRGANDNEIARAVRHSMVVIDAEKHGLNYKQSFLDNGIPELKVKYQGRVDENGVVRGGASTIVSRSKSDVRIPERKPRAAKDGGPINPVTGEKMWEYTGNTRTTETVNKRTGVVTTKTTPILKKSQAMLETVDAHTLSSGQPIERVYANHANKLKALANDARKNALATKPPPVSPSAKKVYAQEVGTLTAKLNVALKNKPLERQAQILATAQVKMKRASNPDLDDDGLKKLKTNSLNAARIKTGARKQVIEITPLEWNAIQHGAVSSSRLKSILDNMDDSTIKQLATPRDRPVMTDAKIRRAQNLLAAGYTQAEIADSLGVPTSTLHDAIK